MVGRASAVKAIVLLFFVPGPSTSSSFPVSEFVITTGFSPKNATSRSESYSMNRGHCALLCMNDMLCTVAFFSAHLSRCFIYDSYSEPWMEKSDWVALVKVTSYGATVSSSYGKMVGAALTTSGNPVAHRLPLRIAANERHCQLICEGTQPACSMFGFSNSTRQCVLFDLVATTGGVLADASIYTYYRFNTFSLNTISVYSYTFLPYDVTNISWTTFSLQTCNDGHVTLQPSNLTATSNAYELPIGASSNTETLFRRVLQGPVLTRIAGIFVSCSSSRKFWISWTNGVIRFGTGSVVGESTALSYTDSSPYSVRAIGISGWVGTTGVWSIYLPKWF